jgi:hypothetical protein
MFGPLGMTVQECIAEYKSLLKEVLQTKKRLRILERGREKDIREACKRIVTGRVLTTEYEVLSGADDGDPRYIVYVDRL